MLTMDRLKLTTIPLASITLHREVQAIVNHAPGFWRLPASTGKALSVEAIHSFCLTQPMYLLETPTPTLIMGVQTYYLAASVLDLKTTVPVICVTGEFQPRALKSWIQEQMLTAGYLLANSAKREDYLTLWDKSPEGICNKVFPGIGHNRTNMAKAFKVSRRTVVRSVKPHGGQKPKGSPRTKGSQEDHNK